MCGAMKFRKQVTIYKSIEDVLSIFKNVDLIKYWNENVVSVQGISGAQGEIGSTSIIHCKINGYAIEAFEEILENRLPEFGVSTYRADKIFNKVTTKFSTDKDGNTLWTVFTEYKTSSCMLKIIMLLAPNYFKRMTTQYMGDFKKYVETAR